MKYHKNDEIYQMSADEYPEAMKVWSCSVKATHQFLSAVDYEFYRKKIEGEYLETLTLYGYRIGGRLAGFSGVSGRKLSLLFLHPDFFGGGIGKRLLLHAVNVLNITIVDVNAQNERALEFYKRNGFKVIAESPVDGCGKPYPMICMSLNSSR